MSSQGSPMFLNSALSNIVIEMDASQVDPFYPSDDGYETEVNDTQAIIDEEEAG